jgi:hypothetical protein
MATNDSRFGEICHEYAEVALRRNMNARAIADMLDAATFPPGFTAADARNVITAYVDYVRLRQAELELMADGVHVIVEKTFQFVRNECWGTPDCVIVHADGIDVIDLKSGSGHAVDAERNPQLLTYAAMVAKANKRTSGKLRLTVVQPRRFDGKGTIDSWETDIAEAVAWGKTIAQAIRSARKNPTQPPVAGEHCHWCPAQARCPAHHAEATKLLTVIDGNAPADSQRVPTPPELIAPDVLAEIVAKAPMIMKWLKAVLAYAHETPPPGWKLVEGRADREWRSDAEVADILKDVNLSPDIFRTTTRVGVTAATKILKQLGNEDLADRLFVRPRGKPTLVPVSDPRPSIAVVDQLGAIDDASTPSDA